MSVLMSARRHRHRHAVRRDGAWVWNPAAGDELLARACVELRAGRFGLAAEALATCRQDPEVRARRSALLATAAADVDAAEYWLAEAPQDADALLLVARTAVVRACRARSRGADATRLTELAFRQCQRAADRSPWDVSPWAALLMLAAGTGAAGTMIGEGHVRWAAGGGAFGSERRGGPPWSVHAAEALAGARDGEGGDGARPFFSVARAAAALEDTLVSGPWELLFPVWARDARCREAHAWFLECLHVQDACEFAALIRNATPVTAAVQLLPLSASVADYRRRLGSGPVNRPEDGAGAVWQSPALRQRCVQAFADWFGPVYRAGGAAPVREFSLLAHGLFMTGECKRAAIVIDAMKPFACAYPWSVTAPDGDGARAFVTAARELGVSAPRRMSASESQARYG